MPDDPKTYSDIHEDEAIRFILEGTATDVGRSFFTSLVHNLAHVLQTAGAWVTEYFEENRRLNALAFYYDGTWLENFSYNIANTACERVIMEKRLVHIPDRLL